MSYNGALGTSNTSGLFAQRLAQALRRRMASGLTLEQLSQALSVSKPTAWSWLNGVNEPKGRHVVSMIAFFDASFANEILDGTGATVVKLADTRKAYEKAAQGRCGLTRSARRLACESFSAVIGATEASKGYAISVGICRDASGTPVEIVLSRVDRADGTTIETLLADIAVAVSRALQNRSPITGEAL
jgi:transcriptional regulator with XRE-family HTH domain